jgi:hypothetical protein
MHAKAMLSRYSNYLDAIPESPFSVRVYDRFIRALQRLKGPARADVLPALMEPKAFTPLATLDRDSDGSFILKVGVFEAYVEGYSLDADRHGGSGGFYPVPFIGKRAEVIQAVLKQAELHPNIQQADIQALLTGLVSGSDLESMPTAAQQAAVTLLL